MSRIRVTPLRLATALLLIFAFAASVPVAGCGGDTSAAVGHRTAPLGRDGREHARASVWADNAREVRRLYDAAVR